MILALQIPWVSLEAIRAVESCLGSCGIANLAILQLGVKEGEKTRDVVLGFEKGGKNYFGFNKKGFGVMAKLVPQSYKDYCNVGPCGDI
ncbi:hypothetical protein Tco_0409481, partial [Tanacetum coccineum]